MKERLFVKDSIRRLQVEDFIKNRFADAKCSDIEMQRTPLGTRIVVHTTAPGLIIGRKGQNVQDITQELEEKFGIKNPQIDVQKIQNPDLDPEIVAKGIAESLERGINYKKIGNFYISKIMESGAIGCEIVMAGKLGGERGRSARFVEGYLKKCGDTVDKCVLKGFAVANPKLGNCGISVAIMVRSVEKIINMPEEKKEELKAEVKITGPDAEITEEAVEEGETKEIPAEKPKAKPAKKKAAPKKKINEK